MRGPEAGAHNTRPMKAAPPPSRRGLAWRLRPCRSPQRWSSSRLQSLGVCGGGITGMAFDLPLLPLHRLRRSLSIRPWAKVSATISSSDRPTLQAFETGSGGGSLGPIRKFAHPGHRRFRAHLGPPPFPSSGPLWPRSSCGTRVVVGCTATEAWSPRSAKADSKTTCHCLSPLGPPVISRLGSLI